MDTTIEKNVIETLERRAERRDDRRKAIMMGGAALAGLMLTSKMAKAQAAAFSDTDVLNFALNLEYLEAQFYTLATAGVFIDDASVGIPINSGDGSTTGGTVVTKVGTKTPGTALAFPAVQFQTPVLQSYAMETATEEQNHVKFLQAALKTAYVAMPNLDLYNSFNALASAAGIGSAFDPFANETNFLLGAFIFEDVGVTAYNGGAAVLTMPGNLQAAAGILAVEAYHAGSIRTRIYAAGTAAQGLSQQIAAARASLSAAVAANPQGDPDDHGVFTQSSGASTIVDADANGITYSRTPAQVINIVYGGVKGGGAFFPNGLNGGYFK